MRECVEQVGVVLGGDLAALLEKVAKVRQSLADDVAGADDGLAQLVLRRDTTATNPVCAQMGYPVALLAGGGLPPSVVSIDGVPVDVLVDVAGAGFFITFTAT